jgi:hypothetical protein
MAGRRFAHGPTALRDRCALRSRGRGAVVGDVKGGKAGGEGLGDDERPVVRRDTMPFGKASSFATSRASPVGVMSAILPAALPLVSTSLNSAKS